MQEFDEIYSEYFSEVYKFVFSLCQNPALAEEITQEAFFKALKNINKFKGNCKLSTWLCKIAKNTFYSYARKHNSQTDYPLEIIFSSDDDNSQKINIKIPELGNVTVTEDTIEKRKYATVVSISSEYFLRTIKQETKGDTIYIYAFKTTLFNNTAENYQKTMNSLEFKEINKIVFVDNNEKETVLWSK